MIGFDPKTLSDDELLERWHDVNKKIMWSARFGSMELLQQLQSIKLQIEFEQRERMFEIRLRARAAMPTVLVETDPDLARQARAEYDAELAKNEPKKTPRQKPYMLRERIRPTARPKNDDNTTE